jgi:hypothetical protein
MSEKKNENPMGRLVLHSIPTKETEEMLVSYLGRIVKNVSSEKIAQKIKQTPFVFSKNISSKKGEKIAQNLRDLGARAEFVPHVAVARDPDQLSDTDLLEISGSPLPESIQKKSHPSRQQDSSGLGKQVITAIVVICLVAIFSLLAWQLYVLIGK